MKSITTIWVRLRDVWGYRHEPERLRVLADTYWRVLLVGAACAIVLATVYGGVKLFSVLRSDSGGGLLPTGSGGNLLKPAELQATLDGFAAREVQYELLKKNPLRIADPSK